MARRGCSCHGVYRVYRFCICVNTYRHVYKDKSFLNTVVSVPMLQVSFSLTGLEGSYWLDASDLLYEGDWVWSDDTRVDRGTPFWAIHSGLFGN